MGILIRSNGDPKEWTPDYSTNAAGGASWSGKHVSGLTAMDLVALLDFCGQEAPRVGWNDAAVGRTNVEASNPFHPDLLGGYPYREWATHYVEGICEHAKGSALQPCSRQSLQRTPDMRPSSNGDDGESGLAKGFALLAAITVLRDAAESRRMPHGAALDDQSVDNIHDAAAMLDQYFDHLSDEERSAPCVRDGRTK